ncbi:hypothetical protein FQN54_005468 [Arachnomyces sp. PD_36]|nr:hypothetical protein FQN54_005468 [Arachnomyces sp. PD_36]
MFRRRRNSSRAPQNPNPSPSAQTAAAQAFLASQASNANLSSAAAATALRTHTPTPTPIEHVQTKRMLQRRSSSSSSRGIPPDNVSDGPGGRGLHRSSSSGSMTTRTFRDPSPGRVSNSDAGSQHVPPVPPLPQNYPNDSSHRRTSSLEPPYHRTTSPQLKHSGGRGGSLDRSFGRLPPGGGSPTVHRYSSLRSVPEDRPGSRGSINFSYPINNHSNSPRQSPVLVDRAPHNDNLVNGSAQAGDKPKKKKKKKKAVDQDAVDRSLPSSAAREALRDDISERSAPLPREEIPPPESQTFPHALPANNTEVKPKKKKKKKRVEPSSQDQVAHLTTPDSPNRAAVSNVGRPYETGSLKPVHVPRKRPSIVREDPEGEEREDKSSSPPRHAAIESASAHDVGTTTQSSKTPLRNVSNEWTYYPGQPLSDPPTRSPSGSVRRHGEEDHGKQVAAEGSIDPQTGRQHSLSPTRSTRFSSRLAVSSTGEPLHEPPPRSVSPAKSALKAPHPPHSLPAEGSWSRPSKTQSETSEGTSAASEDGSRAGSKKKTVKVSFEDEAEIVGTAASPPTSPESSAPLSPLGKSTTPRYQWQAIDRSKACFNDGDGYGYEDVLRPRPALPSFGSVRGRREEVVEDDPSIISDASSIASSMSNMATMETSLSSDHAVGGILAAENKASDRKADTTAKTNDPLPPQVTPIEGTGYGSDSDVEVRHDSGVIPSIQYTSPPRTPTNHQEAEPDSNQSTPSSEEGPDNKTRLNGSVPVIAVQPATPALEEERGFPSPTTQSSKQIEGRDNFTISKQTPVPTPSDASTSLELSETSTSPLQAALDEEDRDESDNSGESVYSDAAEDLSDLEGDGFGSINAIVESPAARPPNFSPRRNPPESPSQPSFAQPKATGFPIEQKSQDIPKQAPAELLPSVLPIVEEESLEVPKPKTKKKKKAATKQSVLSTPLSASTNKENTVPRAPASDTDMMRRPLASEYGVPYGQSFPQANGKPPSIASATQDNAAKPPPEAKTTRKGPRPISSGPLLQGNTGSVLSSQVPDYRPSFPQGLERTLSNGSDSSSSFKRPKRRSNPDGRYTMRRTMRTGSGFDRPWSQDGKGSNGTRTLSPQGRRPFSSSSNGSTMRMTMRGPPNANANKLNEGNHVRSSSFSGFGKGSSLKKSPMKLGGGSSPNAKLASRFGNSNEGDAAARPKKFSSRFEDSSDDEDEKFTPVRGIPRRKDTDDGDSTDLEDSSDEETGRVYSRGSRRRQSASATPITGSAISTTAAVAASGANRPGSKQVSGAADNVTGNANYELEYFLPGKKDKKPSLFHRLTTSKRDRNKDRKIHKSQLDSAARRDTSLERSRVELERMRLAKLLANEESRGNVQTTISGGDAPGKGGLHPSSSKLRKKPGGGGANSNNISDLVASGSWPLRAPPPDFYTPPDAIPEKTEDGQNGQPSTPPATETPTDRPHTADGVVNNEDTKQQSQSPADNTASPPPPDASWTSRFRPRLPRRQGTDSTYENSSRATSDAGGSGPTTVGDVVVDAGGKRKKFPLLRRALGIGS